MDGVQIILYFMMPDRRIVPVREFLDDPALCAEARPLTRGEGGLKILGPDDRILIQDDFAHLVETLLVAAPDRLDRGEDVAFDYRYTDDRIEIRVADDMAVIDDLEGTEIALSRADLAAGLRAAAQEWLALQAAGAA